MIKTARKGWSKQLITVICTEEDVWISGSGKGVSVVPFRIIFWTLFLIISAVTIYIFLSLMSGGVHYLPYKITSCEKHILWIPIVSGYARKCYHVCFDNTGMKCHQLPTFLFCVPTPTYISVQMDRHNLWWEQTGARGGGSQQLTADILSVQATLWSNFTLCVSVNWACQVLPP